MTDKYNIAMSGQTIEVGESTAYDDQPITLPLGVWTGTLLHLERSMADRDNWAVKNAELRAEIIRLQNENARLRGEGES